MKDETGQFGPSSGIEIDELVVTILEVAARRHFIQLI